MRKLTDVDVTERKQKKMKDHKQILGEEVLFTGGAFDKNTRWDREEIVIVLGAAGQYHEPPAAPKVQFDVRYIQLAQNPTLCRSQSNPGRQHHKMHWKFRASKSTKLPRYDLAGTRTAEPGALG